MRVMPSSENRVDGGGEEENDLELIEAALGSGNPRISRKEKRE